MTIIIGEYGIIGLFIFFNLYTIIFKITLKNPKLPLNYKLLFVIIMSNIFFQDIINNTGSVEMLLFPAMVIPAYSHNIFNKHDNVYI